jgi:hypothetical protein
MKNFKRILLVSLLITFNFSANAQALVQTIRGTITDKISQSPLTGANIIVIGSNPLKGTSADLYGNFTLKNVPVGMQTLKISFLGYKDFLLQNITVTSGKEVVLNISLEENIIEGKEINISANTHKEKSLNEFSTVSTRTFSVEETQKYAAAVNDPARMSMAFAGIVATDDGNNNIAIRGNAPNGLLWRMEGVEIPNPNHFSGVGTSGGAISILSSQLLSNSDFLTGAFAAEYGNAISGVFDLKLRKGNNERTEHTIQAGFLGTDLAIEGPFKKGYDGSYLINYRYSTLALLKKMGVPIGDGVTTFQDLSFNIFLPTKHYGNFSIFGFGGLSKQIVDAKKDSSDWKTNYDRYSVDFKSNTGAAGVSHFIQLNSGTFLKTTLITSGSGKSYYQQQMDNMYNEIDQGGEDYAQNRISLSTVLTKKFNARHSLKTGIIGSELFYILDKSLLNHDSGKIEQQIGVTGKTYTLQSFVQWNFRVTENFTLNTGLHSMKFGYNKSFSLEPRAAIKYDLDDRQSLSIGYGLHTQVQPIGIYFSRQYDSNGNFTEPNKDLGFTKAHHFVAGYDRMMSEYLHVKVETYYQQLFDVPVSKDSSSTLSLLNSEYGFESEPLINNGKGRNYGVELTIEQFLHNNLYFLLSSSLYNSKYQSANGNWYNTRFNGGFAMSFTAGKEIKTGEKFRNRILGLNIKTIYSGGLRNSPIDYNASVAAGETKFIESQAYTLQSKNYFRADFKISMKRNRQKSTTTWSLDFQNVTNHKNEAGEYYDPYTGKTKMSYQAPLIPVLSYKVDF